MSSLWRVISAAVVLGAGVAIAWVDTRPTWDGTGVTAMAVMAVATVGSLARVPGWLAAVCAVGPLLVAEMSGGPGVVLAVPLALAGAYAGVFIRHRRSQEGPFDSRASRASRMVEAAGVVLDGRSKTGLS